MIDTNMTQYNDFGVDSPLTRALSVATSGKYTSMSDIWECLQTTKVKLQNMSDDNMATWVPRDSIRCKITKCDKDNTVIMFDTNSSLVSFASPCLALHNDCPCDVVFHCQYVEDILQVSDSNISQVTRKSEGVQYEYKPRFLVYDISFKQTEQLTPRQRYDLLRTVYTQYLSSSMMVVQWVGYRSAALALLEDDRYSATFPHTISSIICLTSDPFVINKQIHCKTC